MARAPTYRTRVRIVVLVMLVACHEPAVAPPTNVAVASDTPR
jgi:hypothetical protein